MCVNIVLGSDELSRTQGVLMTLQEARNLDVGDEIFWLDPDDGLCSGYYTIALVKLRGTIVCITSKCGSYLECYPHELR